MKKTALQRKIQNNRYVKSEVLKYIRQNTIIIEDKYANYTGYYHIGKVEPTKNYVLVDWDLVCFAPGWVIEELLHKNFVKLSDLINHHDTKSLPRWFA